MAVDLPSPLHRISPKEYRRLVEAEVFDEGARVELIEGLLVDMSAKTPAHESVIAWLSQLLVLSLDLDRFQVRVRAPLTIGWSEPEPDLIVIERDVPRPHHPATAALVIEVAVSSQRRDLRDKPRIYARAGVPVYWVVDVDAGRAVAHSSPRDEAYERVDVVGPDGELDASHLALSPISVAELLAALPADFAHPSVRHPCEHVFACLTPSSTAIPPSPSWTVPPFPPSWWPPRSSAATPRWH